MTEPTVKSCGVIIVQGDPVESFLLMKHPDRWDLPKGHVDPGETEIECALREMEEETGISRDDVQLVPDFRCELRYVVNSDRYNERGRLKSLVIFLARVDREPVISVSEHEEFRWFPWSPPHRIQERTIDPVLKCVEEFLSDQRA